MVTVKTPAKLILSGEHAVLYNQTALAVSIDRFVTSTIDHSDNLCLFHCETLKAKEQASINALLKLKDDTLHRHQEFLDKKRPIETVLRRPIDLMQIACIDALVNGALKDCKGIMLDLTSTIPMGLGAGSSAAVIINILFGIFTLLKTPISQEAILQLAIKLENLQHGTSSGLDLTTCLYGGLVYFKQGHLLRQKAPSLSLFLIDASAPSSSTGMAVKHVLAFKEDIALWKAFEEITLSMEKAIASNDIKTTRLLINENHALLQRIGVVPKKVQDFIKELHTLNIAAKISGAGAVGKDANGGAILAITEDEEALNAIANRYDYCVKKVICCNLGTQII